MSNYNTFEDIQHLLLSFFCYKYENSYFSFMACNGTQNYMSSCHLTVKVKVAEQHILGQEDQRCPKRRIVQAAIRLATAVIKFRNKENVRSPS